MKIGDYEDAENQETFAYLNKISKKSRKSLACVDELRIFLGISFVISKLFCTFVI